MPPPEACTPKDKFCIGLCIIISGAFMLCFHFIQTDCIITSQDSQFVMPERLTRYQYEFKCNNKPFRDTYTCHPSRPIDCPIPKRHAFYRFIHPADVHLDNPKNDLIIFGIAFICFIVSSIVYIITLCHRPSNRLISMRQ